MTSTTTTPAADAAEAAADLPLPPAADGEGPGCDWIGPLAELDEITADGRLIAAPAGGVPVTRPMPLALVYRPHLGIGHEGAVPAGLITRVWIDGTTLYGLGVADHPELVARLEAGESVPVGVDLDRVMMEETAREAADFPPVVRAVVEASGVPGPIMMPVSVAAEWRLMGACAYGPGGEGSFPTAHITRAQVCEVQPAVT